VSTVTFYTGKAPVAFLKARLGEILQANPWIGGRLTKKGGRNRFVCGGGAQGGVMEVYAEHEIRLDMKMTYEQICDAVVPLLVKRGVQATEAEVPVFRLSLIVQADGKGFALVASMSHVVGDGATFYSVHNMVSLDLSRPVRADSHLCHHLARH
jgi:hypothetical protein